MKRMRIATTLLLLALLAPAAALTAQGSPARPAMSSAETGGLLFIENAGQWPVAARFQVWGGSSTAWLAKDAVWLTVVERSSVDALARFDLERLNVEREKVQRANMQRVNVKLTFPGANPQPVLEPFDRLETHVSYFIGADPEKWRADVPVWGGMRYVDLYPGVDLIVGAGLAPALDGGRPQGSPLPWRLEAREGADLAAIRLRVEGADAVAVEEDALRLSTAAGDLALPLLTAEHASVQRANLKHANVQRANGWAFDVTAPFAPAHTNPASRDASSRQSQIQNPQASGLLFATFLGGSYSDEGSSIAVDGPGQAYVTGSTWSADFPASRGPGYDTSYNGGDYDTFVVKLDTAGTALLYATFLGGSAWDYGSDIAVDGAGQAYVTGNTGSADFPASLGPGYDTSYNGGNEDAFVVKLDAAGTGLRYATFLGGSYDDRGYGIAVDDPGQAYVTGRTRSTDFPASRGPGYDTSYNGGSDAFVVKLDAAGTGLRYATFLGGSYEDYSYSIAVDDPGQAYVTGNTGSADFPASRGPGYDTSYNGGYCDAFVVKLDAAGTGLRYATFLGGSYEDYGYSIAVDGAGGAYVTGLTESVDFPASLGPGYDTSYHGYDDAFVVKLDAAGTVLRYATFLGGSNSEVGFGIALDGASQAYVTGTTASADFPASLSPGYDTSFNGDSDAFVVKLDAAGTGLRYATFLGGSSDDSGSDIAVDGAGLAYVTGSTWSADFPASLGPGYDTSFNGGEDDAFVVKLDAAGSALPTATPTATATPTPTSTPTPTATPTGPWASWAQGNRPLLVPPAGAPAVVDYSNQAPPVPFAAQVAGAALFDTAAGSGTTSISTTLPAANGSYAMTLIPAIGATGGQTLTVRVEIGPVTLTKDGWIARLVWLPVILRR